MSSHSQLPSSSIPSKYLPSPIMYPSIFLIPFLSRMLFHWLKVCSSGDAIESLDPMVGSPPPMIYRSPLRVPSWICPLYPILVSSLWSFPNVWIAAPVVRSFMLDAGTSIVLGLCAARISPQPVVTQILITDCENVGSEITLITASSTLPFLLVSTESGLWP